MSDGEVCDFVVTRWQTSQGMPQRSRAGSSKADHTARQMILHGTPSDSASTTVRWPSAARLYSEAHTRK